MRKMLQVEVLCFTDTNVYTEFPKRFSGIYRRWFKNGQLEYEDNYKDGKLHGICRRWYKNGQLDCEDNYKDGKRYGICRGWSEFGGMAWEDNFKEGLLISSSNNL